MTTKNELRIYGHSDDLVEVEGVQEHEIDCYEGSVEVIVGWPDASEGQDARGVAVRMRYGRGQDRGCWGAEVSPLGDGIAIPWPISLKRHDNGYSTVVTVHEVDASVPVKIQNIRDND